MRIKSLLYFIGIINITESLLGFLIGEIYIRHWHKVSFTEILMWFCSGILFLYLAYKSKKQISHSICPKCEETFNYYELKDGMCPYCDIPTKDLDGYYSKKEDNK